MGLFARSNRLKKANNIYYLKIRLKILVIRINSWANQHFPGEIFGLNFTKFKIFWDIEYLVDSGNENTLYLPELPRNFACLQ